MPPNAHDAFFKEMLSRPEQAASVLSQILPARIAARIDFTSLAPCSGSYVDETLKERHSDLLFSVTIDGRPGLAHVRLEHQSGVAGVAAVAIDDGGAVYLQVGETVRRFPSIDAMPAGPGEPLAEGVLLTVPRHANSNCCGL